MVAGRTHIPVVEKARCHACLTCMRACPVWVLKGLKEEKDSLRSDVAGRILFPDLPKDEKYFQVPPCVASCPLNQDVPGYLSAIAGGDITGAAAIIRSTNPLPSVLGRVCLRPCVKACIRGSMDQSPDIRGLKYFAVSAGGSFPEKKVRKKSKSLARGKRVAIIGAGPAGLSAAGFLAAGGVEVTLYEKHAEPGGMLRYGLGEFDLPCEDLKRDVDGILAEGVEIKTGVEIKSLDAVRKEGADAVLIATGAAGRSRFFEHSMKHIPGVRDAASYMGDVRRGKIKSMKSAVVVEGFGPWAVTAARAAVRLGAEKVMLVTGFSTDGHDAARDEGVEIISPARVIDFTHRSGRLLSVKCQEMTFKKKDIRGRLLQERGGDFFMLKASAFIYAMGGEPDCDWIFKQGGVKRGFSGTIQVDPATLAADGKRVFAAGDVATGPRSVISAAAMGLKAAKAILQGWEQT